MKIVVPQSEGLIARCHDNPGAKDESGETIDLKEEQRQFSEHVAFSRLYTCTRFSVPSRP